MPPSNRDKRKTCGVVRFWTTMFGGRNHTHDYRAWRLTTSPCLLSELFVVGWAQELNRERAIPLHLVRRPARYPDRGWRRYRTVAYAVLD
ncbi:Hypothetical protein Cp106_0579 [Corynebacterium pseudotuberculosis 1/06-A]|nr:Hypothetical protein Cp106_0579 [Corynebacterium pseudotuberculosis 1/06-A]